MTPGASPGASHAAPPIPRPSRATELTTDATDRRSPRTASQPIGGSAEPAPSSAKAASSIDPTDPQAVWGTLLAATASRSALGWVKSLRLDALARGEARLSILPGQRDMARFIGDRQRTQLAQMLGDIVGQPVKVQVNLPASPSGGQGDDGHEQAGGAPSAGAISAIQRQQVMALPMVRQLMASFDVSLVEVRRQQDTPPLEGDEAAADTPAGQALADGLDMAMDDTHDLLEDDMDV